MFMSRAVSAGRARETAARDAFLESGVIMPSTATADAAGATKLSNSDSRPTAPTEAAATRGQHSPIAHKPQASDPAAEELAVSAAEFSAIHELRLAFARAASRLVEMSTSEYLAAHAGTVAAGKWEQGHTNNSAASQG